MQKIVMEKQYHNKEKIKALEEMIVKQNNDIIKLQNMEETLNLQRQEITALNEIVNEMTLKWKKDRQDTMLLNDQYYGQKDPILVNKGNNKITELRTILQRESPNS